MATEYKIPIQFKQGKYVLSELPTSKEKALFLVHGDFHILSYSVPENGTEVRLYDVTEQPLENYLFAIYNDEGQLKSVELIHNGEAKLVFVNYSDDAESKAKVLDFAEKNAAIISDELIKCKEKAARLFIEYYRDCECFDYAAKIGTIAGKQTVIDNYGLTAIDNSGNYPNSERIPCDGHTLDIMLLCADCEIRDELMDMAINVMTNIIKDKVIDVLDKSDDFKFISEEYD